MNNKELPLMTVGYLRELDELPPEEKAKRMLSIITQGEWMHVVSGVSHAVSTSADVHFGPVVCRFGAMGPDRKEDRQRRIDAEFVARAPGIIRELVEENARLRSRLEDERKHSDRFLRISQEYRTAGLRSVAEGWKETEWDAEDERICDKFHWPTSNDGWKQ